VELAGAAALARERAHVPPTPDGSFLRAVVGGGLAALFLGALKSAVGLRALQPRARELNGRPETEF